MRAFTIVLAILLIASVAVADKKAYVDPMPGGVRALDCTNAIPIYCGDVVTGDNTGLPDNATYYSCTGWNESGGEVVYEFVVPAGVCYEVTVALTPSGCDLDVFFLGSCDENDCITYGDSGFTTACLVPGTYYIVVDGYSGAGCPFELAVTCVECECPVEPCGPFEFICYEHDFNFVEPLAYLDCGLGPNPWEWGVAVDIPDVACDGVPITDILGTTLAGPYPVQVGGIAEIGTYPITADCYCLELCHMYDTENNYDGGNVKVSLNGGITWTLIYPAAGYPGINTSSSYPCECVWQEPIFTGDSGGFVKNFFDLSAYEGMAVDLGFFFGSESWATSDLGWYIKWARIGGEESSPVQDATWGTIKAMYR